MAYQMDYKMCKTILYKNLYPFKCIQNIFLVDNTQALDIYHRIEITVLSFTQPTSINWYFRFLLMHIIESFLYIYILDWHDIDAEKDR